MLTLDVAISTYKPEGIERVAKMLSALPSRKGVNYIVSWQQHEDALIPESLILRGDVEVHRLDLKGLSNNRNNGIDHCNGDIVLIADDDLEYTADFAEKIVKTFEENPQVDLATFKIISLNHKKYPSQNRDLELPFPKNYYISSVEIAFRRERLKGLKFYPELGLGSPKMYCGEEEFFVASAIKRGYVCRFINLDIATHSEPTTGNKISNQILRGKGFVISAIYPKTWIVRIALKAYRESRFKKTSFLNNTYQLSKGALQRLLTWQHIPKKYRW
ncbi:MAG: glycosyltransferase family 2 protein [Muribaculaceae bacterium]|nr:glycosyltransferase family 2 protein [Muribaculaceae bacterium]